MMIVGGRGRLRVLFVMFAATLALMLPTAAAAQDQTAVFTNVNPPAASFEVHQSMLRFEPGTRAALHHHGGPGYITILTGEVVLDEDGFERTYHAGDSFIETPDKDYKAHNPADEDMTLMVTYLVPTGQPVTTQVDDGGASEQGQAEPEPIAETVQTFQQAPQTFDLVQTVKNYGSADTTGPVTAAGDVLMTVVTGSLTLTIDGVEQTVSAGDSTIIEAGSEYSISNANHFDASVMSTEFAASADGSLVPPAGGPAQSYFPVWLLLIGGAALLVGGGAMRSRLARG